MTERSLYAGLGTLILWLLLLGTTGQAQQPAQPPCPLCLAITISSGQAVLLPEDLRGITIVVLDGGESVQALAAAVDTIRSRAGRPVVLGGDPRAVPAERTAYALKLRLTDLRSRLGGDVRIALRAPPDRELAGYADVLIGPRQPGQDAVPLWPLVKAPDLKTALAATTVGGAEQWVMDAPADAIETYRLLQSLAGAAAVPADAFVEGVEVRGARRLTANEIVARHQAFARRQAALVTRTISEGVLTLTFEAPGFPAPITISSDTVIYTAPGVTDLEQRAIRVNGIEFKGGAVPRLPLLEPERVAAPPLAINLTSVYTYRLLGEEVVDRMRCYVVTFEPLDSAVTLFRGRAWIAMDTFAMVRVAATQTALRGPIVSSEQVDTFRKGPHGMWLLARSDVRQIYEGAAHRTPIHRLLTIKSHEIDPPQFDARLRDAHASSSVMLRDTPDGYRYLKRVGSKEDAATPVRVAVAERSTRVRTVAGGVIIDPNISVPLPFAGVSYVDFDLFGTGAQVNAFFGGTYGQLALSAPSLGHTRWQLAGRAFGIASSYNDRAFQNGREIYEENLKQRPAHASVWLLHPITPRLTIRTAYEFDYTRLSTADETSPSFVVPANQVVHGARVALEGQRGGWAGSIWWNPARRAGWRMWGRTADAYAPETATFQRYGVGASRSTAIRPTLVTRVEATFMAGHDLDRFSQYTFGTFDNRLHGYPSALVRYDRGAVARGSVAWSVSRFVRLDGFLDSAVVRDRGYGRSYRNYTGIGAAVEAPAPFGILGAIEWGYGFRGLNADGTQGTHVIRVSAYKVF
jgi:hypothetical protein